MLLLDWFQAVPPITRIYMSLIAVMTLATHLDIISPFNIFFSSSLILKHGEYWRILTSFLYLGSPGFDWLLHVYFLAKYCEQLEGQFRNRLFYFNIRTADFLWMLIFFCFGITVGAFFVSVTFLSQSLVFSLTYIWSRRNPDMQMGLFGIINFKATYLCWVLLGFSFIVHQIIPYGDLLGLVVAHIYYYFDQVYPRLVVGGGRKYLQTPGLNLHLP